jgi:hypothetical protein
MPKLDWQNLAPHRPIPYDSTDALYVPRPEGGGDRLAAFIEAGFKRPILVAGPAGVGKSTELSQAWRHTGTGPSVFAFIFPLDRSVDMRRVSPVELLNLLVNGIGDVASKELEIPRKEFPQAVSNSALLPLPPLLMFDALLQAIRRVRSEVSSVVLMIDGLEKCPEEVTRTLAQILLQYREEVTLVLVVPPSLVTGPANYDLLAEAEVFPIRPVPVQRQHGANWEQGQSFLRTIALRRLGPVTLTDELDQVISRAAAVSGGLPRDFLQLLQKAATYATLAGREEPNLADLDDSMADHRENLRRLLREGDADVLKRASGTDGLEIPLDRRLRFLVHGLLLEYKVADQVVVYPAPLLDPSSSIGPSA